MPIQLLRSQLKSGSAHSATEITVGLTVEGERDEEGAEMEEVEAE